MRAGGVPYVVLMDGPRTMEIVATASGDERRLKVGELFLTPAQAEWLAEELRHWGQTGRLRTE